MCLFYVLKIKKRWLLFAALLVFCACANLWLRSENQTTHAAVQSQTSVRVPIIMYHSILKDKRLLGDFIISPEQLESDLQAFSDQGYHTVVMQDLIDFVYHGKALPEKPIVLTFDDGQLNNITYALPLLQKYEMRAVLSIVGVYTEKATLTNENNVTYSYLSWEQAKIAQDSGVFEIQNHTYDMHYLNGKRQGCKKRSGESLATYTQALSSDLMKLQSLIEANLSTRPTTFTYPFGFVSDSSVEIIKNLGFQATLSCAEGVSTISQGDADSLIRIRRTLRSGTTTTAKILQKIQ